MKTVLLTGFPGFLGSALVERLLDRYPTNTTVTCVIQGRWRALAEQKKRTIEFAKPTRKDRILLVEGDITRPGLGMASQLKQLYPNILEIYHLAAVYDLSVRPDFAQKVNVEGTRNVLDIAERCPNLTRFQYVSTCYVSGRYDGVYYETDLEKGQIFNNFYEETKFRAEVEVQERMANGLPTSIYRPGIVVCDSKTGQTQKYDGPYVILKLLMNQTALAFMPTIDDPQKYTVNVVPQDFVVNALDYLSAQTASQNKVYQLANPHPPTVDDLINLFAENTARSVVKIPVPELWAKGALTLIPFAQDLVGVKPEALDYFTHPTHYDVHNTLTDLGGSSIFCPPLPSYIRTLVAYMKQHPDISGKAMV